MKGDSSKLTDSEVRELLEWLAGKCKMHQPQMSGLHSWYFPGFLFAKHLAETPVDAMMEAMKADKADMEALRQSGWINSDENDPAGRSI